MMNDIKEVKREWYKKQMNMYGVGDNSDVWSLPVGRKPWNNDVLKSVLF